MKVQHGKDPANHSGPESCGDARESAAEALTGETGGSGIEPRNQKFGTPTLLSEAEGKMSQGVTCESWGSSARSETLHTSGNFLHRSWEISAVPDGTTSGDPGKAKSRTPGNQRGRSRMRSYYLGSHRTKAFRRWRWWREGAQPKGTLNRTPHPGHRAGIVVCRRAWKAYVRQRVGIGGCGSRRSCITSRRSY